MSDDQNGSGSPESDTPSAAKTQQAFQTLVNLALQSRRSAKGLPSQVDIKPHWSGVGFELLGRRFVAPMGEVSEMLEVPHYTRLPGVQPWVRGVANVRGRLLPVCDLAVFFGDRINSSRKQQRILVLENEDLYTGVLVDQVFGMQHFPVDTYTSEVSNEHPQAATFSEGCYLNDGVEWTVFSPAKLSADAQFLNAAQN
ncbi:chemotaxis protein CheW [Aestuariicella hydrocarbonica]|uniref:Chemotaxis protein CheW n=1 Tax=Pseudomaricurvus hydrocarbonicus TaxID=1470433 RepID=A0A9E5MNS2_9GAMM|nr:chemotaxis protein CheW [Aestuariicella hydrocarbonica]NHO67630.1 chemotaxis protein CheW [Aestuariicella hydrocarbonica]